MASRNCCAARRCDQHIVYAPEGAGKDRRFTGWGARDSDRNTSEDASADDGVASGGSGKRLACLYEQWDGRLYDRRDGGGATKVVATGAGVVLSWRCSGGGDSVKIAVVMAILFFGSLVEANAQVKPGIQISLQGLSLWQDVGLGGDYAGSINCLRDSVGNLRKRPICKQFPALNGSFDLCDGKVQSISADAAEDDLLHIDRDFAQQVHVEEIDFGQPSSSSLGDAQWDLGDVQVEVREVQRATDWWAVMVEESSPRSRRSAYGCSVDNGGALGKVVPH